MYDYCYSSGLSPKSYLMLALRHDDFEGFSIVLHNALYEYDDDAVMDALLESVLDCTCTGEEARFLGRIIIQYNLYRKFNDQIFFESCQKNFVTYKVACLTSTYSKEAGMNLNV